MRELLVIQEVDLSDNNRVVIGVADSIINAEKMIDQYYGRVTEISRRVIQDSGLEYEKVIEIPECFSDPAYRVKLVFEWFTVNWV